VDFAVIPNNLTTKSVEFESNQIIGRNIIAIRSIVAADASAIDSVLYSANRFGTNSPNTKEIYAITKVIPTIEIISLAELEIPSSSNLGIT